MKALFLTCILLAVAGLALFLSLRFLPGNRMLPIAQPLAQVPGEAPVAVPSQTKSDDTSPFLAPLDRASERVTKKRFGTFVTPEHSPVQPERFSGFHTGIDFEIFPEERDTPVAVRAVCDGTLVIKRSASGYGGVMGERCSFDGNPITVVYGHLKLSSSSFALGDTLKQGDALAELGAPYSKETDGERKHLHLGFHRGTALDIRGYAGAASELSSWIDPCLFFCR